MKKKYLAPAIHVCPICTSNILTGSNESQINVYNIKADDSEML